MVGIQAIINVMIRLWAATYVFSGIQHISASHLYMQTAGDAGGYLKAAQIYAVSSILLGIVTWIISPRLSKLATPPEINVQSNGLPGAEGLVAIGCFLIGAFYFVEYVPELLDRVVNYIFSERYRHASGPFVLEQLFKPFAALIAGTAMAIGARQVGALFGRLRTAGIAKDDQ